MRKCLGAVSSRKIVRLVTLESTKSVLNNSFLLNKLPNVMAETSPAQNSTRRGRRLKWTEDIITLLECKRKAIELVQSRDPPKDSFGRMKGYMVVIKE